MKKELLIIRKLFTPRDKKKFLALTVMMAFSGIMEMAGIGLLAGAVALFLNPESGYAKKFFASATAVFPQLSYNLFVFCVISAVALLLIIKNIFSLLIISLQSKFLRRKQCELTCRFFDILLNSDYRSYIDHPTDRYSGIIERIKRLFDNFFQPALQLVADIIVIACLITASLFLLPWSAIVVMLIMVAMMFAIHRMFQKINRRMGEALHSAEVAENKIRLDVLLGMEPVKLSGAEEYFSRRFATANAEYCRRSATLYTLGQIPRLSLESLALLLVCAIFALLLSSGTAREEIILVFTIIVAAMARVLPALSRAHYSLTQLKQYSVLLEEFTDNFDTVRTEPAPADAGVIPPAGSDIVLKDVSFSYMEDTPVISNLSCTFAAGKITGIAGRSGMGKTTLINLLSGLFTPASGTVCAGEVPICHNLPAWRKQIAVVPQNPFIFSGTLRENIVIGIPESEVDDEKIIRVLRDAQIPEFACDLDKKLDPRSGLSGGQRQRIAIARALYREPAVLILDEATSALDEQTENGLLEVLHALRGKTTIIVISHRQDTLATCDRTISL